MQGMRQREGKRRKLELLQINNSYPISNLIYLGFKIVFVAIIFNWMHIMSEAHNFLNVFFYGWHLICFYFSREHYNDYLCAYGFFLLSSEIRNVCKVTSIENSSFILNSRIHF